MEPRIRKRLALTGDASLTCVLTQSIASRSTRGLLPFEILELVDRELSRRQFTSECTAAYLATIRGFVTEHIAHRLAEIRRNHGMFEALEREEEWDEETDLSLGASGMSHSRPGLRIILTLW